MRYKNAGLFLASTLLFAVTASSQSEPAAASDNQPVLDQGAHLNPLKIAELKWYIARTTTEFKVGKQPYGLCFDGANIWSANYDDGTVIRFRLTTERYSVPIKSGRSRSEYFSTGQTSG
jgi:hypothetical protein